MRLQLRKLQSNEVIGSRYVGEVKDGDEMGRRGVTKTKTNPTQTKTEKEKKHRDVCVCVCVSVKSWSFIKTKTKLWQEQEQRVGTQPIVVYLF